MTNKIIALIAPSKDTYSETFIKAHRELLHADIRYYYCGVPPTKLENFGDLTPTFFVLLHHIINKYVFRKTRYSLPLLCLINSFKRQKIEKVYVEYGTTAVSILEVCKKLKLPMIVNFHGYDASINEILALYREGYQQLFKYVQSIVVVSRAMEKKIIELGADKRRIIYSPCAPNEIFFENKPLFDGSYFVAIGRFVDKKAPYYTLLAFKEICERFPLIKLYFAGNGPLLNTCRNLVKYWNLDGQILLLDVISPLQLLGLYKNAIAFVQHSIIAEDGDMEGTPVSVLEASAAGLPVISTYHAGISDVIIHEKTGLLVQEHDVKGMVVFIERLINDVAYAKQLGSAGRNYVQENYSMNKHISTLDALL